MSTSSDSTVSSSSVLTNVAPPSALPSFLTSPLPPAVSSTVPLPGPSPPPPPGQSFPSRSQPSSIAKTNIVSASGQPFPPPSTSVSQPGNPSILPFSSASATSVSSVPTARSNISQPPPSTAVQSSGARPSSTASEVPPFPLSHSHPSPPSTNPVDHGVGTQPYYAPPPNVVDPVTSQPQPPNPNSESSAHASASVDIGSPGIIGPTRKNEGPGWFGWIRGTVSNVGHRVAERAKTSMDSMITTLDPQMKEFIHSGGDMDIIVASDKEVKVGAMREAFQMAFGKATVCGMKAEAQGVAAQPVGFEAALNSAEGRINCLRSSGQIHPQQPIVAVENFIVEFNSDCWFDIGLLLLDDPGEDILLQTYTQVTPIPPDFVNQARRDTPEDYPFKDSGFAVTVGQIASQSLQVHHSMWQESLTGVSRREALVLAGRTLAGLYRSRLPSYH